MYVLPLLMRELSVASRRPLTTRLRTGFGAGVLALSIWATLIWGSSAAFSGGAFFTILFWLTALGTVLIAVVLAADSISLERREGTLPLLFLTDLGVWDLVIGKFAAVAINPLFTLLSVVPSLAIWQLVGGLSIREVGRAVLVLLTTLLISTAATLFVSSLARRRATAILGSILLLAVINPLYLMFLAARPGWRDFGLALFAFCLFSLLLVIGTMLVLQKTWQEEPQSRDEDHATQLGHAACFKGVDEKSLITSMFQRSARS